MRQKHVPGCYAVRCDNRILRIFHKDILEKGHMVTLLKQIVADLLCDIMVEEECRRWQP